jgi:hypothetical protein
VKTTNRRKNRQATALTGKTAAAVPFKVVCCFAAETLQEERRRMDSKAQDALVILKLYEIRSETLMRTARAWFFSEFNPRSGREIVALLASGEKQSAYYRMVSSHWEVAAALVNNHGVDEKMFLEANSEHLVVFAKLQPFLSEIRETIGEPDYLSQLEQIVMKVPNVETKLENRRRLIEQWASRSKAAQT